jgi:beta-hydroxylase
LLSRYSLVPVDPILDKSYFPWLTALEAAAPAIRGEAEQVLRHVDAVPPMNELSPDHRKVARGGGWRSFFLVGYRYPLEHNAARCPETMKALAHVPRLVTAMFSILEPGMHVGRHRGLSRGIVIAHLGLKVPAQRERCRMQVVDRDVTWEEGRTFVFDDTYEHEVWNDTDERRLILLVQFERPMRLVGRLLTDCLIRLVRWSPYIQDARRNVGFWERRFRASEGAAEH